MVQHFFFLALALLSHTNVFAQEYTYDVNGNLISDGNKEIASIHYNHLNLVDTVTYADGRKMIYTFTASGQKLREQSILANGTVKQKRDYSGTILYRNDSLQEIKHEDGRIIPGGLPAGQAGEAEYQYHLTDHLGNVRTMLTTKQDIDSNTATYESTHASIEQSKYLRYEVARRINSPLFNHTGNSTTFYSERLNGSANEKYGIARSLSVMPGDSIKLEVFAKYVDPNSSNWTQALTTLLTQITAGTAPAGTVVDGANYATNGTTPFPFAGLNNTANSTGAGPKAYLNWLIFDRNFVLKTGGYVKMTDAAKENGTNVAHERLATQFTIKEAGYVYVYLSNEEATPKEVYFDDLSVIQVKGPIVQENDYDPFGLTFNEYTREKATPNKFLYNGKELQSDFELNWYDYGARMYDAALGRWHVTDPLAEKYAEWSPYNYVMNNPVKFIDPDGRDIKIFSEAKERGSKRTREFKLDNMYLFYMHNITSVPDHPHAGSLMRPSYDDAFLIYKGLQYSDPRAVDITGRMLAISFMRHIGNIVHQWNQAGSPAGKLANIPIIEILVDSKITVEIREVHLWDNEKEGYVMTSEYTAIIYWDPFSSTDYQQLSRLNYLAVQVLKEFELINRRKQIEYEIEEKRILKSLNERREQFRQKAEKEEREKYYGAAARAIFKKLQEAAKQKGN